MAVLGGCRKVIRDHGAPSRLVVQHAHALAADVRGVAVHVRGAEGDVVDALPVLGQPLADRGVLAGRLQQLEVGGTPRRTYR